MIWLKFLIPVIVFPIALSAQRHESISIKGNFQSGMFDAMGNMFLVSGNELQKFNQQGKLVYRYSNAILGNITSVDVSDPLKPFVFYADAQMVVYLNQQLGEISGPFNIASDQNYTAIAACNQPGSGFWFFDQNRQVICRMNSSLIVETQTIPLNTFIHSRPVLGLCYVNNRIVLFGSEFGFLVFDKFGNLLQQVNTEINGSVAVWNNQLHFASQQGLMALSTDAIRATKVDDLPDISFYAMFRNNTDLVLINELNAILYNAYFNAY